MPQKDTRRMREQCHRTSVVVFDRWEYHQRQISSTSVCFVRWASQLPRTIVIERPEIAYTMDFMRKHCAVKWIFDCDSRRRSPEFWFWKLLFIAISRAHCPRAEKQRVLKKLWTWATNVQNLEDIWDTVNDWISSESIYRTIPTYEHSTLWERPIKVGGTNHARQVHTPSQKRNETCKRDFNS